MSRGDKTRCGGVWTEARYFSFIRSNLRYAWRKYPIRVKALTLAKRAYIGENKRQKWEYLCAICNKWSILKDIEVDHLNPAGSLKTFSDLPGFVERLFCELENVRVLCKPCHRKVTNGEIE